MPKNDLKSNSHFLEFLFAEKPEDNGMQIWILNRYMLKSRYYPKPIAQLYKAKETLVGNDVYPEHCLVLYFANIVLQMCLPISTLNMEEYGKNRRLLFDIFPSFALEDIRTIKSIEMYQLDLTETRKVSITDSIVLHYEKLDKDV